MFPLSVQKIKEASRGRLVQGNPRDKISSVSIDSRTIKKGALFIAIKGPVYDGHQFISQAIKKGAAAVMISQDVPCREAVSFVKVRDTGKALGLIALWYRRQFQIPVIAVTGSAGKTTTKEMIAAVLSARYNVLKNKGTQNNHYGVPLTLLQCRARHDIAVLELGTNQPGDIAWLAKIVDPDVAVFTNIGASHLEGLKTVGGVFREKFRLVRGMSSRGIVIFNGDDAYLRKIRQKKISPRKISFSIQSASTYRALGVHVSSPYQTRFRVGKRSFTLKTSQEHNVMNALAAISCGYLFNVSYNNINTKIKKIRFPQGRGEIHRLKGVWLVDDTYNANPVSFGSAIRMLDRLRIKGKKIVVCGDMMELGSASAAYHAQIGRQIAQSSIDTVLTLGSHARQIAVEVNRARKEKAVFSFGRRGQLHRAVKRYCHPGNVLLVKGSRAARMDQTVAYIEKTLKQDESSPQ